MPAALESTLSALLASPGVTCVALIDAVTGLTYASAGEAAEIGDGVDCSEMAVLIADQLGRAGAEGELESVVVTSAHRHHVIQSIRRQGDPLLLVASLDRQQTNLALAIRRLADGAEGVLA